MNFTVVPTESLKNELWLKIKAKQKNDEYHQYCMLWCPADDEVFVSRPSEFQFYQDLTADEAAQRGISYYTSEGRDVYQNESMSALKMRCCQIATRESFDVVYDTRSNDSLDTDVTLVTFGTVNRMDALQEIKERWRGPVVFVLYVLDHNDLVFAARNDSKYLTSAQELRVVEETLSRHQWDNLAVVIYKGKFEKDREVLRLGWNANYFEMKTHSFYNSTVERVYSRKEAERQRLALVVEFPINSLRNVAQDFVQTRYLFSIDLDFIPDISAYDFLKGQASFLGSHDKVGIVLPHFQRRNCTWNNKTYAYPMDFQELDYQMQNALITPFHCDLHYWSALYPKEFPLSISPNRTNCFIDVQWPYPHSTRHQAFYEGIQLSDYPRWLSSSRQPESEAMYEIPEALLHSEQDLQVYEPYMVLDRVANSSHALMRYNEVFVSRHRDKSSWIFGLRLTGYRLFVANEHFLIHKDHRPSVWVSVKGGQNGGPMERHRLRMFTAADTYVATLNALSNKSTSFS
eukprot:TRINITY_DN2171_c0_g1_i1.p1 TRINITY_DN2171_c0_g1~~TRINITY_DN2171_c0_g1_i1.p1  ORF type:complete len:556 (-),score=111.83 TRINITY_DN2171_c0_g1_i1:145-1692(-)